ncbi:MAG TPA: VWA domain-containing protein [Nitrososphaeraceae archaeon]|nr:VWA domain-containing protein [Nitrososphaeraceae archaeon]
MKTLINKSIDFVYFPFTSESDDTTTKKFEDKGEQNISNDTLDDLLKSLGKEILKEKTPSLHELEQTLQEIIKTKKNKDGFDEDNNIIYQNDSEISSDTDVKSNLPIVTHLIKKGYIKNSEKWLSNKGFATIGEKILQDILKELKKGDFGIHETKNFGYGSLLLDTTKKYEIGDDIRLINIPNSLLNSIQRLARKNGKVEIPIKMDVEDFEEYETIEDVRVSIVYCIDLSSTMRYSTLYGDLSRIEAAKRALWSLYILNKKYFPSDIINMVGFGALASKINPPDIPYLKTFEPGVDFLHYTNYQAALRLAKKILQKNSVENQRIVLITDGHPSACFIDNEKEQQKILSQRPYSHFYIPDKNTINSIKKSQEMNLDVNSGELVYLCYRYRQVDQFIGERTIIEAKKCYKKGIQIDTIMISEEDSMLSYVNEMEKYVKGRSYYINPASIDKILLTDYISNKKKIIHSKK